MGFEVSIHTVEPRSFLWSWHVLAGDHRFVKKGSKVYIPSGKV